MLAKSRQKFKNKLPINRLAISFRQVLFYLLFGSVSVILIIHRFFVTENKLFNLISMFLLPITLLVMLSLIILIIQKKWTKSILLVIVLMIGFQPITESFQWNKQDEITANTFSLMTYNAASFHPDRYNRFTGDEMNNQRIFQWFKQIEQPDILCIQEFFNGYENDNESTLDTIRKIGKYSYYYLNPQYQRKYDGFFGVATFSKFRAINSGELLFGRSNINKGVFNDFIIHGDTVRVVNVHLSSMSIRIIPSLSIGLKNWYMLNVSNTYDKLMEGYENHISEINYIFKFVSNSPYKVILCGDFNSFPYNYPYQKMKTIYKNAFEEKGRGFGITYHYKPFYGRIDQIFFDPSIKNVSFKVHTENNYSDHYPISAKFNLKE